MISFAQPLPIGNAIKILMAPPNQAVSWRLLRKASDDFTGHDDPAAALILEGTDKYLVDRTTLINGTPYYYKLYWTDGSTWTATPTVQSTPSSTYEEKSQDVLMLVRERLDLGLQAEVSRGVLKHHRSRIRVMTAFPWAENEPWPVVTVHLSSGSSDARGIGELLDADDSDGDESEGWFERVQLDVIGWSQNPDERQALRQAIRRIIIGNLPIFDDAGFLQIDLRQVDAEEPGDKNTIIYKSVGSFSCLAPVMVAGPTDDLVTINDVTVNAQPILGG